VSGSRVSRGLLAHKAAQISIICGSAENTMPRELIDTGTDKRFVRRDQEGKFKESDDVGRSLAADQKRDSRTKSKRGEGDKGDR